jgi:hypothetical protein
MKSSVDGCDDRGEEDVVRLYEEDLGDRVTGKFVNFDFREI